jgi:hypothetical protein
MLEAVWHQSNHIDSRVLELNPPHELGDWEVYRPYGSGKGVVYVHKGVSATPPNEIAAMCRVNNVWRVISDQKGYFIVTVINDRLWSTTESEVIQAYVSAKEKDVIRAANRTC